jgi:hypothetical protein
MIAHGWRLSLWAADDEGWPSSHRNVQICGDIGNHKKHGHNQNHSEVNARPVPEIFLGTSRAGLLEFHHNGATKQRALLLSHLVPIP